MTTTNPAGNESTGTKTAAPFALPDTEEANTRGVIPGSSSHSVQEQSKASSFLRASTAFSLVEIVLALGLVSFSVLAIFALVAQGQKTSRESRLESVSAILAGRINSLFRASSAWDVGVTKYTENRTLTEIAAGPTVAVTNYLDQNLSNVASEDPARQFAVVTEVGPLSSANLTTGNVDVADALSSLGPAANAVFLKIEISQPALAPAANRSKRYFTSIITRSAKD